MSRGLCGFRWMEVLRCRPQRVLRLVGAGLLLLTLLLLALQLMTTSDSDVSVSAGGYTYDSSSPLIFIGGFPRSGTTLMRAMLDAHPDIRCGQETRIIPRILSLMKGFGEVEKKRMHEGGVTKELLDRALTVFLLQIIRHHGEAAKRLCDKDPFIINSCQYLQTLFPNSKFIFMVRDGRASIYSAIKRKVTISGLNFSDPADSLTKWSVAVGRMASQCEVVGPVHCMKVHYEQLVLHPTHTMRKVLTFLSVPWDDTVLHHETEVGRPSGVILSRHEKSSDQIIQPVNAGALAKWVGFYPSDVVARMSRIAPMLSRLGYDPEANPPNYGTPDTFVINNTELVQKHRRFWKRKAIEMHLNDKLIVSEEDSTRKSTKGR